jgi:hypothetical protein
VYRTLVVVNTPSPQPETDQQACTPSAAAWRRPDPDAARLQAAGTLLTLAGVIGLSFGVLDAMNLLPLTVARWRVQSEALWILIFVLLLLAGLRLTWRATHTVARLHPTAPGMRFHSLVLYSRSECGLCEEARAILAHYREYLPPVVEVDIDTDPATHKRFATCIPVIEIDGKVRFRGRVSEVLLRRLIERTAPIASTVRGPILRRR